MPGGAAHCARQPNRLLTVNDFTAWNRPAGGGGLQDGLARQQQQQQGRPRHS